MINRAEQALRRIYRRRVHHKIIQGQSLDLGNASGAKAASFLPSSCRAGHRRRRLPGRRPQEMDASPFFRGPVDRRRGLAKLVCRDAAGRRALRWAPGGAGSAAGGDRGQRMSWTSRRTICRPVPPCCGTGTRTGGSRRSSSTRRRPARCSSRWPAPGMCHSDEHLRTGDLAPRSLPIIGGHEGAGVVPGGRRRRDLARCPATTSCSASSRPAAAARAPRAVTSNLCDLGIHHAIGSRSPTSTARHHASKGDDLG